MAVTIVLLPVWWCCCAPLFAQDRAEVQSTCCGAGGDEAPAPGRHPACPPEGQPERCPNCDHSAILAKLGPHDGNLDLSKSFSGHFAATLPAEIAHEAPARKDQLEASRHQPLRAFRGDSLRALSCLLTI